MRTRTYTANELSLANFVEFYFFPRTRVNRPFVHPASERRSGTFAGAAELGPLTLGLFLHTL
jgi:hypothetical protein